MKRKKRLTIFEFELPIVLEKERDDTFVAKCPSWKDCYAQGDTIEEAINEISYVASSLIELYKEEGLKIPLKLKNQLQKSISHLSFKFPLIVTT
jgi:predicted RNase H-like HicB family nuclease